MPSRYSGKISTGITIEAPEGYKLCFSVVPELAERGLVASNAPGNIVSGEVIVQVLNAGHQVVVVNNGDPLIDVWLEKIEPFVWESK